ncbi:MAG: hypothetical protein KAT43_02330 [Nanoarchaeota archaeon]|nr:hypothetical protein [Nanoarchaeota archaeon]
MNFDQACTIIENNKALLEEKTYIKIKIADRPFILAAHIDYKELCDASMYLFDQTPFITEVKLNHDKTAKKIITDTSGLDLVLERAKKTKLSDVPISPGMGDSFYNRRSLGILHAFATYNNNRSDFHTHPAMHDNLEDLNYFLSYMDLIYGCPFIFFPLDYATFAKIKTEEELEQERQATAKRMEELEIKGFMVELSNDLHTIAPWWEALDHLQTVETEALITPMILGQNLEID